MRLAVSDLRRLAESLLEKQGVGADDARLQADLLIEAELRGLASHGLQRLPRLLRRLHKGLAAPVPQIGMAWVRPTLLSVDGGRGLGPVVAAAAIHELADTAASAGLALAALRNTNHLGMLAYYAEAAVARGFIGIILSTSEALVHPFGGTRAMLGTNPIAIGIPTGDAPFILDLATSVVSMGRIHHHALTGQPIPAGWAVTADGTPTTDAAAASQGAIAPFGDAKGYGLGLAVELLVAALAGSAFAPDVRGTLDDTHPANKGDLILLIDPSAQGPRPDLVRYLDLLRGSPAADPARPVAIPGDGARARRQQALAAGIDLPPALHHALLALQAA